MFQVNRQHNQQERRDGDYFEGPLINEYKKKFACKRILQTIFGGCLLKFDYKVPFYVYFSQIAFFILPFIVGGIGILVKDLNNSLNPIYVSLVASAVFCFLMIIFKISLICVSKRKNEKKEIKKNNILDEEDVLEFNDNDNCAKNFCTLDKLSYLFPNVITNKPAMIILDIMISFFIIFSSVYFLSINYLTNIYNNSLAGAIIVFILSWIVVCNSLYSLLIRHPFELSQYTNDFNDIKYLSRSFYVCIFFIVENIYNFQSGLIYINVIYWLKLFFLTLPILFSFGFLPPFDAFMIYLIEQSFIHLYGMSFNFYAFV
jgi:hypothetical protein